MHEDAEVLEDYGFNVCVAYQRNNLLGVYQRLTLMGQAWFGITALKLHEERL